MNKYFEIYVAGKDGYSLYVVTNKTSEPSKVLALAVQAAILPRADAEDVEGGAGFCEERSANDIVEAGYAPQDLRVV